MKYLLFGLIGLFTFSIGFSQNEKLIVEGAIVLDNNDDQNPVAGTIRWTGSDFEGFDGTNWISLTCCDPGIVTDCDGNTYATVTIGGQTWFAENLQATCYNDGSPIPFLGDFMTWNAAGANGEDGFTFYDFGTDNSLGYGGFYNWYVVDPASNGGKNACPIGWHVPSIAEFEILKAELNGVSPTDIAGGRVKSNSSNWNQPNVGTFDSGFLAEPYGSHGTSSNFVDIGFGAYFYTTDVWANDPDLPHAYWFSSSSERFRRVQISSGKVTGTCIRCLKD